MADIRHRVGIAAPRERVYEALATKEGLAGWWTGDVRGDAQLGGTLQFYFSGSEPGAVMEVTGLEPGAVMEVTALEPGHHVGWRCVGGADEWVGTKLTFDLKPGDEDGKTVLLFTHADWREPVEFMYHCSTKWAYYLLGLKAWLEGGTATPHPSGASI